MLSRLLRRLRYLIRQRQMDADLADELAFHNAMKQSELERSGLPPRRRGVRQPSSARQRDARSRGRPRNLDLAMARRPVARPCVRAYAASGGIPVSAWS